MINKKIKFLDILKYFFLTLASFMSLFPFIWMILGATNKTSDITSGKILPGTNLMNNLNSLLQSTNIFQGFLNTLKITVISTILTLLITSMAAYGFERYSSRLREGIYKGILFSMMVPFAALMIPLFRLIVKLGLIDNYWAIILPSLASGFIIFYFRQSFKSIPNEIIEAARIDGANELTIFFRVIFPSMRSVYASAGIIIFMTQWNNFLWPLIALQTDKNKTLTLMISSLSSAYFLDYGQLMLAIVIATLPIIVIFLLMQKQFVEGITGSSK